jgi:hypothetical protein
VGCKTGIDSILKNMERRAMRVNCVKNDPGGAVTFAVTVPDVQPEMSSRQIRALGCRSR